MIFVFYYFYLLRSAEETASCVILADGTASITAGVDSVNSDAWAFWNNSINDIGWYTLHIEGRDGAKSANMLRCAGVLEGYLSQHEIYLHFQLIKDFHGFGRNKPYSPEWRYFMEKNMNYTFQSCEAYQDSEYWQQISLTLSQFQGLYEGYNIRRKLRGLDVKNDEKNNKIKADDEVMSLLDFWFLEAECELYDIENALKPLNGVITSPTNGEDCTGLIRLLPDFSDIYFAQDTWSDFRDLHGELKEYHFPIHDHNYKANRVLFSTRVGKLFSYDDFYIADSGLLVMETTMSIFNMSLYDEVVPENLLTWFRATHAMWTTDNGEDWTREFIKHNSGTLNNQYLILDTKKFTRYQKPEKGSGLLWMIEQYPGDFASRDLTDLLIENGYFPSINVPFTERLYKKAGYPEKVASMGKIGDFFSYNDSARFKILDRESRRIQNFDQFKELMTYNNYKRDPYSKGDPAQAIMSRYDLRRPGEPYGAAKAFGGLDSKCIKLTEFRTKMLFHTVASPTHESICDSSSSKNGIEPWIFGEKPFEDVKFDGLPKVWNFNWTTFKSSTFDPCGEIGNDEKRCLDSLNFCGFCTYSQKCMAGDKNGPFLFFEDNDNNIKCESGWKVKVEMEKWAVPVIATTSTVVTIFVTIIYAVHFITQKRNMKKDLI